MDIFFTIGKNKKSFQLKNILIKISSLFLTGI